MEQLPEETKEFLREYKHTKLPESRSQIIFEINEHEIALAALREKYDKLTRDTI
jgi:hypothetical protein